ncbi:MAG: glycosyltransferase family 39 protein [Candidatus Omnitrophica bacterium]|nr:glycosyltransferase family 39 protein [Candidatus Omnitrophota bacterium]
MIKRGLFYIIIIALAIKAFLFFFALVYAPQSKFQNDSYSYLKTAEGLSAQGVFGARNTDGSFTYEIYRTPGYPAFIAFFHGLLKVPLDGILILQIILSLLAALFVYKAALIIDPRIAFLSAVIILLDLPITIFSLIILSETLFLFLIALAMYVFVKYLKDQKLKLLIFLAVILAGATYVRPISYYLGVAAAIPIIYVNMRKSIKKTLTHSLIFLILVYSCIGVWHYRNYIRFKEPVFSSVSSSDLNRFGIFKSYTREKQAEAKNNPPVFYYIDISCRSLMYLMTSPGSLKDFKCLPLRVIAKAAGYLWVVFWMLGFIIGLLKIKYNIFYQAILLIILYFTAVSIAGISFLADERFRVPMMPFIAVISAYGWNYLFRKNA